jgi:hypothetical protein
MKNPNNFTENVPVQKCCELYAEKQGIGFNWPVLQF